MSPIATFPDLSNEQADGLACVVCREDFTASGTRHVHVGYAASTSGQVFACEQRCAPLVGYVADPGEQIAIGS